MKKILNFSLVLIFALLPLFAINSSANAGDPFEPPARTEQETVTSVPATKTPKTVYKYDLKNASVVISLSSKYYTGGVITPTISVMQSNGTPITNKYGSNYTISIYDSKSGSSINSIINAGTYNVTVFGKGTYYKGQQSTSFEIKTRDIKESSKNNFLSYKGLRDSKGNQKAYVFYDKTVKVTGVPPRPVFYLKYNNSRLTENKDYKLSFKYTYDKKNQVVYGSNKACITVTGMGNYSGAAKVYFDVLKPISKSSVANLVFTYDSTGKSPNFAVKYGDKILKENSDYTLKLVKGSKDIRNAGQYTFNIQGKNTFGGLTTATININRKDISRIISERQFSRYNSGNVFEAKLSDRDIDDTHRGSVAAVLLVYGTDYKMSVNNLDNTVTVLGMGNFKGEYIYDLGN